MTYTPGSLLLIALLGLGACATMPTGPAVMVLPGTGKNFDQFRFDDGACRQFAYDQVAGVTPSRAADGSGVRSAAAGTLLGAAAGAAIDGSSGAATGAGVGLLFGGLAGAGAAERSAYGAQYRYDIAYQQCMYAKGHRIPVTARFTQVPPASSYTPPPPPPNQPPPR
jgi:OmpA family protein